MESATKTPPAINRAILERYTAEQEANTGIPEKNRVTQMSAVERRRMMQAFVQGNPEVSAEEPKSVSSHLRGAEYTELDIKDHIANLFDGPYFEKLKN